MAVSTLKSNTGPATALPPTSDLSRPSLSRASTQPHELKSSTAVKLRRAKAVGSLDHLSPMPHALPLFRSLKHATTVRRYDEAHIPFFFLQCSDPYVTPLSGKLSPRQYPPAPQQLSDSSGKTRLRANTHAFAALNEALHLHDVNGMLVMHHDDGQFKRNIALGVWSSFAYDARSCAIISCLLRLSPTRSWYLSDSELISSTLAAACLMAGCLVRRDISAAESFVASIPIEHRGRARALTQAYAEQHDLWRLEDYLQPEVGVLGETALPEPWFQPNRWLGLVKGMALWLLDMSLTDQDD